MKKKDIEKEYFSISQVMEVLNISRPTVYKYLEKGELTGIKFGDRKIYIHKNELERFLNGGKKNRTYYYNINNKLDRIPDYEYEIMILKKAITNILGVKKIYADVKKMYEENKDNENLFFEKLLDRFKIVKWVKDVF